MPLQMPQMPLQILSLPVEWRSSSTVYYAAGAVAVVTLASWLNKPKDPLSKIPSVGSNTLLGSWWDGVKFLQHGTAMIQEGYEKYKGTPFKVSTIFGWIVIVSGRDMLEDFCKRRDDELNLKEAINEVLKLEHSFDNEHEDHPYHITILRQKMNRNLAALYDDMRDELIRSMDEEFDLKGHEWKSISPLTTIQQVVSRTSNRIFVGLPLCRVQDWVKLNVRFSMDIFKMAAALTIFPKFLTPLIKMCMKDVHKNSKSGIKHITPLVAERRKQFQENGESWDGISNDFLTWLLEGSEGADRSTVDLTRDVLSMNFAAIHTTSQAFTLGFWNLAASPEYAKILREEVEPIVEAEGWSKASLSKMHKVDSFMKETKRIVLPGFTSLLRKAVQDVTLIDGSVIPKGTYVCPATQAMHTDEEFYENATTFNPFRFAEMRTGDENDAVRYQFPSTGIDYMSFGHGRNACPGRFFAAVLVNTMLAHVAVSYDVKLEGEGVPGRGAAAAIEPTARILIRKRVH